MQRRKCNVCCGKDRPVIEVFLAEFKEAVEGDADGAEKEDGTRGTTLGQVTDHVGLGEASLRGHVLSHLRGLVGHLLFNHLNQTREKKVLRCWSFFSSFVDQQHHQNNKKEQRRKKEIKEKTKKRKQRRDQREEEDLSSWSSILVRKMSLRVFLTTNSESGKRMISFSQDTIE